MVQALLTGSVDFILDGVAASLPLIQAGRLRPLAKLNSRPLSSLHASICKSRTLDVSRTLQQQLDKDQVSGKRCRLA